MVMRLSAMIKSDMVCTVSSACYVEVRPELSAFLCSLLATGAAPYPAKHTATFSWLQSDYSCISTTRLGNEAAVFPGMGAKDHMIPHDGRMI